MTFGRKVGLYTATVIVESGLVLLVAWGFRGGTRALWAILWTMPLAAYIGLRALEVAVDTLLVRVPPRREGEDPGSVVPLVAVNLAILLGPVAEAVYWQPPFPRPVFVSYLGLALMGAGAVLRFVSVRTLGRYFTAWVTTSADQSLIDTGVYSRIRHPGYTAILIFHLGCALTWVSIGGLILVFAADLPLLLRRIGIEEHALRRRFGEQYDVYVARTGRLIPRIRRPKE